MHTKTYPAPALYSEMQEWESSSNQSGTIKYPEMANLFLVLQLTWVVLEKEP